MTDLITAAADQIRPFSADLAQAFIDQPFSRVDLAVAFAAGFVTDPTDDPHPAAAFVLRVAFADRAWRAR